MKFNITKKTLNYEYWQRAIGHNILCVTNECPLQCLRCPIWPKYINESERTDLTNSLILAKTVGLLKPNIDKISPQNIIKLIQTDTFFDIFTVKNTFDIIGGDPLLNSDLPFILNYLKERNIKIRLWLTGSLEANLFLSISKFVDETFLYLPTVLPEIYNEITGFDYLDLVLDFLDFLIEQQKKVTISCPVYPDTIQDLPLIYDLAIEKKIGVFFHYSKIDKFSKESIFNIKRFNRIKNFTALEVKSYSNYCCAAYPAKIVTW